MIEAAPLEEAGRTELVAFVTVDYAGLARGRSVPRRTYEAANGEMSCGWVPANMSLTSFDLIADGNPWGSRGDLRLLPDASARYRCRPAGAATALDMVMSDIIELDGAPWTCCPRHFLKQALADLRDQADVELIASFEQEFQILDAGWQHAPSFSFAALRRADPFGPELMAALEQAGIAPEMIIPEYGRDQFEITVAPAPAVQAADRCAAVREIVRELARLKGWHASFAPKTQVDGVGNGLHVHFSFLDGQGRAAVFDPADPGGVSALARAFAAGIIEHLPAMVAITAPSPVSAMRLLPHHWSASYTWFGAADREASLRICSGHSLGGADPGRQFNLEFRAADGTANPYLVLGVIVKAGLDGIRRELASPPIFSGDPAELPEEERERLGLRRLPASLSEALEELERDDIARAWFSPAAYETYVGMKRMELKLADGLEGQALCRRYAEIY